MPMPDSEMKEQYARQEQGSTARRNMIEANRPAFTGTREKDTRMKESLGLTKRQRILFAAFALAGLAVPLLTACQEESDQNELSTPTVTTHQPPPTIESETTPRIVETQPAITISSEPTATPTTTSSQESPQTPSNFAKVTEQIQNSQLEDKNQLLALLEKIQSVDSQITKLVDISNTFQEPNGTPILVALHLAKFANLDPIPLYPNFSKEEGRLRLAQNEIFFLRDAEKLAGLKSSLAPLESPVQIAQQLRQFDKEFFQTLNNNFYLEIGSKIGSQERWSLDDIELAPDVQGPSHGPNNRLPEEDKVIILGILERFLKIDNVRIILTNGYGAQTIFYPPPMPMEVQIGRDVFQLETFVFDELGGVFDIKFNYQRLAPYFSTEEIARLLILREQAVEQERNFPSIEAMFGTKEDSQSFHSRATNYPDAIFIGQSEQYLGPLQEPLFAQFLKSPLLEEYTKETEGQGNPYFDWGEFINGEKTRIEALKASNPFFKIAFEYLEDKTDLLHHWTAIGSTGAGVPLGSKQLNFYYQESVPAYPNMALTEMLANSDPRLLELLTDQQKQDLLKGYRLLVSHTSGELFARIFQRAMLEGVDPNHSIQAYLNILTHQ